MANRPRMSREERAKQFMPFAALKGYQEALRKKEKIVELKVVNSEKPVDDIWDMTGEWEETTEYFIP